jgi:hypothetical protein
MSDTVDQCDATSPTSFRSLKNAAAALAGAAQQADAQAPGHSHNLTFPPLRSDAVAGSSAGRGHSVGFH